MKDHIAPRGDPREDPHGPIRTLAVDDSAAVLRYLGLYLRREPRFELVGEAANGQEAVSRVAKLKPDLVVMDVDMPVMDGLAATRLIKQEPDAPYVIVCTFDDSPSVAQAAREAGCDQFCSKEHLFDTLSKLATAWLGPAPEKNRGQS